MEKSIEKISNDIIEDIRKERAKEPTGLDEFERAVFIKECTNKVILERTEGRIMYTERILSRRRFKKMLIEEGYRRKEIDIIMGLEYGNKGYFVLEDYKYWKDVKRIVDISRKE